ncbi:MAG TPA: gamma-glutamyltransferase [Vicinamibacteria bacterium]|nr:gamma-glutamyltransferase [Vicinamibacteria bacterium]
MKRLLTLLVALCTLPAAADKAPLAVPVRASGGIVVSADALAARVGADVLRGGGNAVDAAVATAFALAVTHPSAGNVGGGGFLLVRDATGEAVAYDFREVAPAAATATMFLKDGRYDAALHHDSLLAVGVPGTVAGLHLAWSERGTRPWKRLIEPAIALARNGLTVSDGLARDLLGVREEFARHPPTLAQFSKDGSPLAAGDLLRQEDLARTLDRIASGGPDGFYRGLTARLIAEEMKRGGGLITEQDLAEYRPKKRVPLSGSYRGWQILSMPPPSSGGTALLQMLNVLEGYDVAASGFGSALTVHRMAEAMRRAFADRARLLGDPDFNDAAPWARLTSKEYASALRGTIRDDRASVSAPDSFDWPAESAETTHFSVIDGAGVAVALTYTLEDGYGVKRIVPGGGFLLNNEMGDFNPGPGLTDSTGLIGTPPNLAAPGKRMLSSMTPAIATKDGALLVMGAAGGRTIINTVLQVLVNLIDHGMNLQEAVDAPRVHHQWLPDRILVETHGLSPDSLALLAARGHALELGWAWGSRLQAAQRLPDGTLLGAADRRGADSGAVGAAPPRQRAAGIERSATSSGPSSPEPGSMR